ncbi:MAG: YdgA family protein [Betaproteobacteria bacterium]|nr:YdgA family protein [Betaproteobacteria bacterium]
MKRTGRTGKIVAAIALVAMILGGGSYWAGRQVEQKFRDSVDFAANNGIAVSVVEYQRGIFGATARTDMVFQIPSKEDPLVTESVTVPIIHSIRHGPLPVPTSAARIHSEAQLTEDDIEQFNEFFDSDLFPVADTVIGWAGGLHIHVVSPKFKASIENLSLKNKTTLVEGFKRVYTGTASIMLDKFWFWGKGENGAVSNVEIKNFRIVFDASVKDGVLSSGTLKLNAGRIIVEGEKKETVEGASLAFLVENFDAKAIDSALQLMLDGQEGQEQTIMLFLQRKPVFSIQDAHGRWPEGMASGNFRIAYTGEGNPDDLSAFTLSSDLQMELPRALVMRHISSQVTEEITDTLEGGEENEINVEKEMTEQAGKQMTGLLEKNIFVEKGETLNVDAHLRNGELNLNGKPQPLEILFELIPPFI